jgi:hypothetical protein
VEKQWIPKLDMWLTSTHHLPHAGQDTNAAIESYHGNMKAILRVSKGRLVRRRVDWLIHELTDDVIMKYEYNQYLKESGFISNKKAEHLVINSDLQSLKIPDSCVLLPTEAGQPARDVINDNFGGKLPSGRPFRPDVRPHPRLPRGRGFTHGRVLTLRRRGKNRVYADAVRRLRPRGCSPASARTWASTRTHLPAPPPPPPSPSLPSAVREDAKKKKF